MPIYRSASLQTPRSTDKGCGMIIASQRVTVTAILTTADIIRFGPFPAGIDPSHVKFIHSELDTGTDALRVKVGYSHADGSAVPSGADALFGTALTTFNAASGAAGSDLASAIIGSETGPHEIQKDWFLDIVPTVNANAMAAGTRTVHCFVFGEALGAK